MLRFLKDSSGIMRKECGERRFTQIFTTYCVYVHATMLKQTPTTQLYHSSTGVPPLILRSRTLPLTLPFAITSHHYPQTITPRTLPIMPLSLPRMYVTMYVCIYVDLCIYVCMYIYVCVYLLCIIRYLC